MGMVFNLDNEYNLTISLEPLEKMKIGSEFGRLTSQTWGMFKWFNDPDVPQEEKDKYAEMHQKANESMSWFYEFLLRCGFSEEDIKEICSLPF